MFPKAHLTSHSRMSGSRWVITPSWLSSSWRDLGPFISVVIPRGMVTIQTFEGLLDTYSKLIPGNPKSHHAPTLIEEGIGEPGNVWSLSWVNHWNGSEDWRSLLHVSTHQRASTREEVFNNQVNTMTQPVVTSQLLTLQCWHQEHTQSIAMVAEMQGPKAWESVHKDRPLLRPRVQPASHSAMLSL